MNAAQSYIKIVHRSITEPTSYVGIVAEGAIVAAVPGVGGDPVVLAELPPGGGRPAHHVDAVIELVSHRAEPGHSSMVGACLCSQQHDRIDRCMFMIRDTPVVAVGKVRPGHPPVPPAQPLHGVKLSPIVTSDGKGGVSVGDQGEVGAGAGHWLPQEMMCLAPLKFSSSYRSLHPRGVGAVSVQHPARRLSGSSV